MLRVVETYDFERTVSVDGHTLPALALLEDEDGIRALIHTGNIPVRVWALQALPAGAAYLVECDPARGTIGAVLDADFMTQRKETPDVFRTVASTNYYFDHLPTYREVVMASRKRQEAPSEPLGGFVHLHAHSEYSPLDGLSTVAEMVDAAVAMDQGALAVSDHGFCTGHPDLAKFAGKAGIRPVYGIEAYFVDDRLIRPEKGDIEAQKALRDYYHLILWAKDDEGLANLWGMSTESHRDGFYYKPRMDWETLAKYSKGIMASTACLRGPLTHKALLDGRPDIAKQNLGRLLDIYGDDLFVEIHANQLPEQIEVNKQLVTMAREHGVGLVAAADSHYPTKGHQLAHRVWLSIQTNSDISDDSSLFAGGQDYSLTSETEVRDALAYLGQDVVDECISNTSLIASRADAKVSGDTVTPIFVKNGGYARDAELMHEMCMANWHLIQDMTHPEEVYLARLAEEEKLITSKKFPGYFLVVSDYCNEARRRDILVGPGRGSGGGSLVAYLLGITSIDPVEADLLFARFLTEGRTELPDFDVDFPQSRKQEMQDYLREKWGEEYVTVVGSITRLKSKGIVADLGRAMKSTLPNTAFIDFNKFSAFVKMAEADTAGLGMPWEDLWAQHGDDLQEYRDRYPDLFAMADLLVGRVKTYGQHAAGMVISTDQPLTGRLPLRRGGDDGHMVAQFEKNALEQLGFTKFDLLTLRTLDTLQDCLDLIKARRGFSIDLYSWRNEFKDPQVWEEVSAGHTLGIFQIETASSTPLIKTMKPTNLLELADAITLVRPGPKNSGLTAAYLRRRDGMEEVTFPDERMAQVLSATYGCMIYQEQIMAACMLLAGYDSNEADEVRSILGKKKVDKIKPAGEKFIRLAVEWGGMDKGAAEHLWDQMAEFAKYSFNKAHAYGYAVLAYWCAWLKVHYPVEFLTAALSTVGKDRVPEFIKDSRRLGIQVLPPDCNQSGVGFRAVDNLTIRYGLDAIKGVGDAGARGVIEGQPYASFDDFVARKGSAANAGVVQLLARVGAFDMVYPNRRGLETRLMEEQEGLDSMCVSKSLSIINEHGLSCVFDWASEPPPMNPKTGKKLKPKPVPKKCTKACRQYQAPEVKDHSDVTPYTEQDIREIEQEMLGSYLSSTPFDRLDPEDREMLRAEAERIDVGPEGSYMLAAIISRVKGHRDRSGNPMGFLDLSTEVADISVVVFNADWDRYHLKRGYFKPGALCYVEVIKNPRGYNLRAFLPAI
jgi:DNA polymerase-3 subunit alpha